MDANTITEQLKKYIETNILAPDVKISADSILQDAGIDSFSTIEIILFIERTYGVSFTDDKLIPENFKTLRSLASLVEGLMA